MVDPKLPSNMTAMLMQAQERKNLVNKLINLKCNVDRKEPKSFNHLSTGRINRRNVEVRKINQENQQMLNKIMNIMNRKPKGNGLDGVPLRRQVSQNSMGNNEEGLDHGAYFGNEDIRLVQKNVDAMMAPENSRFSFEINPAKQVVNTSRGVNPFKPEEFH